MVCAKAGLNVGHAHRSKTANFGRDMGGSFIFRLLWILSHCHWVAIGGWEEHSRREGEC